ncbi:MAG: glycosyltransferase [Cyanobacteria bacterium P01_F01_bin.53]
MAQTAAAPRSPLSSVSSPISFSIIIETENLASADLDGLFHSLDALEKQTLSPRQANEVLMVETGDVPEDILSAIRERYSWVNIRRIEAGLEYYQAKMRGIGLTTGEVVVLCDSDCVYNGEWLEAVLLPFAKPGVKMLAGETSLKITGPYSLAMAIAYIFPRFSRRDELQSVGHYFCNNVAFKRDLIAQFPIPGELPMYRGNCVIHAHRLTASRNVIWQQPKAQATHAPPNGLRHFVSRFFMLGYDALSISRCVANPSMPLVSDHPAPVSPLSDLRKVAGLMSYQIKTFIKRIGSVLLEDIRYVLYLPVALPIALAALTLYTVGLGLSYVRPRYWLDNRDTLEALLEHS